RVPRLLPARAALAAAAAQTPVPRLTPASHSLRSRCDSLVALMHRVLFAFLVAGAIAATSAHAAEPRADGGTALDQGAFRIYRQNQALGLETFEIVEGHDSLVVHAHQTLHLPGDPEDDPLVREVNLLVNKYDLSLHAYASTRTHHGVTVQRGLTVAATHYVAFRQSPRGGEGDSRVLPPGRVYVMEAQVVTLFDLIGRSLQGKTFASRPLNLLALGPQDTMLDARVVSLGNETIRWG